ncbi:MAG: metalloregulator ArsR/SmtB family transcription factor [Candidatus Fermentibacteria bacterium]
MEKTTFFEKMSEVGKAFDSPERLRILDSLSQAARSVEDLSEVLDLPVRTVSHHLQKLRVSGFVSFEKQGRHSIYSVSCEGVIKFLSNLKSLSVELLPDMKLHMKELENTRMRYTCPDNKSIDEMIVSGEVIIIDVRNREEYLSRHLPGAVSAPLNEIDAFISEFDGSGIVLAYCSDVFCDLADRAVTRIREAGYTAFRLEDSVTERIAAVR